MAQSDSGDLGFGEIVSENVPEPFRRVADERTRLHRSDVEAHIAWHQKQQPSEEESRLVAQIQASVLDRFDVSRELAQVRRLRRARVDASQARQLVSLVDEIELAKQPWSDPSTDGVAVQWIGTSWFNDVRYSTIWGDRNAVNIAAKFEARSGDLQKYWIRVVAQYWVTSDRMPATDRMYLSNPVFNLRGIVYGYTAVLGIFDFGDSWSKCWLGWKQRVMTVNGFDGVHKLAGATSETRQLIFLEDGSPEKVPLPGLIGTPLLFFLPNSALGVIVELEWEFGIQLEGDGSALWVGHDPSAPVCVIEYPEWKIRPA